MVLLSQKGECLIDYGHVNAVYAAEAKNGKPPCVVVGYGDNTRCMGRYRNDAQCIRVIGYLYEALKNDEKAFEFPQMEELPDCKANYGSHVKTKENRHGGS